MNAEDLQLVEKVQILAADEYIPRFGGKIGISRALIETGAPIPQPPTKFIYANQLQWDDQGELADTSQTLVSDMLTTLTVSPFDEVIVRAGISGDEYWAIDVLPTYNHLKEPREVVSAITRIQRHYETNKEKFAKLAAEWGVVFDPNRHIPHFMIQQQIRSSYAGSVLRHPHNRDIIIQYVNQEKHKKQGFGFDRETYSSAIIEESGDMIHDQCSDVKFTDNDMFRIARMYEIVERFHLFPNATFQMEVGIVPIKNIEAELYFYQGRETRATAPAASFSVLELRDKDKPYIFSGQTNFGVTDPEGLGVSFYVVEKDFGYAEFATDN